MSNCATCGSLEYRVNLAKRVYAKSEANGVPPEQLARFAADVHEIEQLIAEHERESVVAS